MQETESAPSMRAQGLADRAADALQKWIIDGTLEPGAVIVESRLASQLGMSRVPVREALQRLGQQGLVDLRPGHSARVARRSARDVVELLDVRAVLAGYAAGKAAERSTPQDVDSLLSIVSEARVAADAGDWQRVGILSARCHGYIVGMSGNQQLVEIVERSRFQLAWLNKHVAKRRGQAGWDETTHIVEAISAQNSELAGKLARQQILTTRDHFVHDYMEGLIEA
jgi:DNA-binding GntR family transcriptional regulator